MSQPHDPVLAATHRYRVMAETDHVLTWRAWVAVAYRLRDAARHTHGDRARFVLDRARDAEARATRAYHLGAVTRAWLEIVVKPRLLTRLPAPRAASARA